MQKFVCTNCSYTYYPFLGDTETEIEPGTDFNDIDESWTCPNCLEPKDSFMGITEMIQEVYSEDNMTLEEERHIPFYREQDGKVFITVGREDNFHPSEEDHTIEYVGIFDEEGEPIELIKAPKTDEGQEIVFDVEDVGYYEVRAGCNHHGSWRGWEGTKEDELAI